MMEFQILKQITLLETAKEQSAALKHSVLEDFDLLTFFFIINAKQKKRFS